jgi:hypothetical protein
VRLLGFTVDRSGHVLDSDIVTVKIGPIASREIVRNSGHREGENEAISIIDRAQPLPPFPDSMTDATLDLIAPMYVPAVSVEPPLLPECDLRGMVYPCQDRKWEPRLKF